MEVLRGRVVAGVGNFSYWMTVLEELYTRKTGIRLFPGTLNLQLERPYRLPARRMRIEKEEYGGTVSVNLVPCRVFGREAFLMRTDQNEAGVGHHPHTIIEIACAVKLRDEYSLMDGDLVEVEVSALEA
jgi:riboflavin kinase